VIEKFLNGPINFVDWKKRYQSINEKKQFLEARLILLEPDVKSEDLDN